MNYTEAVQQGVEPQCCRPHWARYRAFLLLWEHMNEQQREDYYSGGMIGVRGSVSGDLYRISIFDAGVLRQRDGHRFCLVVNNLKPKLPVEDEVLAKKIIIECDERLFLATAHDLTAQHQQPPQLAPRPVRVREAIERQRQAMTRIRQW